ncbi:MAG: hypothetical protein EZS28_054772, partial [Streblomastix strix]
RNEGEDEIEEWKQGLHSIERLEEKRHNRLEEMKANVTNEGLNEENEIDKEWSRNEREHLYADEEAEEVVEERIQKVIPFQLIEGALFSSANLTAPQSTVDRSNTNSAKVYELGMVTQGVVEALAEAQRVCLPGDRVSVTGCTERVCNLNV